ncbi:MAG TPA: hypothetical protein VK192_08245, partial [Sphingomicrobium sp.]|nr:hypothetical protein [Sphingomicrobium sp.]
MAERWHVKKTGPGLAIEEAMARLLGAEFVVRSARSTSPRCSACQRPATSTNGCSDPASSATA